MPDDTLNLASTTEDINVPPPSADSSKAEHYIDWLVDLLNKDKLVVTQTDLKQFPVVGMEDHYRIPLKDYEIEISHSKHPNSGSDIYVMIFNNMKQIKDGAAQKAILAYLTLTDAQFHKFRSSSHYQFARIKKIEEEKRFKEAMEPIDQTLQEVEKEPDLDKDPVRTLKKDEEEKPTPNLVKPPLPEESNLETSNETTDSGTPQPAPDEAISTEQHNDTGSDINQTNDNEDLPKVTVTSAAQV